MHEIYLLDHFTSANVEGTYSHLGFIHVGPKVGGTLAPAALLSRFRFVISVGQQISTYDFKILCPAVTLSDTLVNRQRHTQMQLEQPLCSQLNSKALLIVTDFYSYY